MHKTAGFFFIAILLLSMLQPSAAAAAKVKAGVCGDTAAFTIDEGGTLTITGTGKVDKVFFDDKEIAYKKIKKIVISEGITELGDSCFLYFKNVTAVVCPDSLRIIGERAMHSMEALPEIHLPEGLSRIGRSAFCECSKLEAIQIPDSVNKIEREAFAYCCSLRDVKLPKGLEKMEDYLFEGCDKLTEIPVTECLQEIGRGSFISCSSLQTVKIPDTVEIVRAKAFGWCTSLKKITFGRSVKKAAKSYARNCVQLRKIVNHSSISISLDDAEGNRIWRVGKKKQSILSPGKTAKAKGKKYAIRYVMSGGKVMGKKPKYHEYGKATRLPSRVKKKGYTFLGWDIYGEKSFGEWGLLQSEIKAESKEKLEVQAVFKKYKVTVKNRRIHVLVQDPCYGKKGYAKSDDYYGFRYSENPDMSHSEIIYETAPYGKGRTKKLKRGKTYYVQIAPHGPDFLEEDDEDFPIFGWVKKRKIKIK